MISDTTAASTAPANAQGTQEIIRTTGERVETGFWATLNEILLRIPNFFGFVIVVILAYLVGKALGTVLAGHFQRNGKEDLGRVLGTALKWTIVFLSALFALMILFPRLDAVNILSVLGVGSVAIGFAFKDIFQNLVAGVILLVREPYKKGDEIRIGEHEGVVEEVETRATHIRTIDKRLVVVPNVRLFTDAITVHTECDFRMTSLIVSIGYDSDVRRASDVLLEAVRSTPGVRSDPEPRITVAELNTYAIDLSVVYAAGARQLEQIETKGAVLLAILDACRREGIELPFPTQLNLIQPLVDGNAEPGNADAAPQREDD